jgi:hypothetical protein
MAVIPFNRNDDPAPRRRIVQIVKVGATDQLQGTILAPSVWGCETHWVRDHSEPCYGGPDACQWHRDHWPVRWKGYIHLLSHKDRTQVFVEITEFAWSRLKTFKDGEGSLRGKIVVFSRERKNIKAPVQVISLGVDPMLRALPPAMTPEETLECVWKLRRA